MLLDMIQEFCEAQPPASSSNSKEHTPASAHNASCQCLAKSREICKLSSKLHQSYPRNF